MNRRRRGLTSVAATIALLAVTPWSGGCPAERTATPSRECESGETAKCDCSVVETGTRTCEADGSWGKCTKCLAKPGIVPPNLPDVDLQALERCPQLAMEIASVRGERDRCLAANAGPGTSSAQLCELKGIRLGQLTAEAQERGCALPAP